MKPIALLLLVLMVQGCTTTKTKKPITAAYVNREPTPESPILVLRIQDDANHSPWSDGHITVSTMNGEKRYVCRTDVNGFCRVNLISDLGIREATFGSSTKLTYTLGFHDGTFEHTILNAAFLRPTLTVTAATARAYNKPSVIQATRNVVINRGESFLLYPNMPTNAPYLPLCLAEKGMPIAYVVGQDGEIQLRDIRRPNGCDN